MKRHHPVGRPSRLVEQLREADARLKQATYQIEEFVVHHFLSQATKDGLVRDLVKTCFHVSLDDPSKTLGASSVDSGRSRGACFDWAETRKNCRGIQSHKSAREPCDGFLNDFVAKTRNAQASQFSVGLGIITRRSG